jgi:hypothetical protein
MLARWRSARAARRELLGAALIALTLPAAHLAAQVSDPTPPPAAVGPAVPKAPEDPIAAKAFGVLDTHCARCHQTGKLKTAQPGRDIANILDLAAIARDRRLVVPGLPDGSRLYTSMVARTMPRDAFQPGSEAAEPSPEEIQLVRDWIEALPPPDITCGGRRRIDREETGEAILKALERAGEIKAQNLRFLTLAHLHNACASPAELEAYRQGVTMLVNSLSWARNPIRPEPVDEGGTILMIDLEAIGWVPQHWERLAQSYPYGTLAVSATPGRVRTLTGTALPMLKADWVAAEALQPPLYAELLGLPQTLAELQQILNVDIDANVRTARARRIGLRDSQITRANRLLERHDIAAGGLWMAYDFAGSQGRRNLLEHPLGPQALPGGKLPFRLDGARALFHLPNGFVGFSVYDTQGELVDETSAEVARAARTPQDPRPIPTSVGRACLACHSGGPVAARDEMRLFAESDRTHAREIRDAILALHPPSAELDGRIEADVALNRKARESVGIDPALRIDGREPILALARQHSELQTLHRLAVELELTERALEDRLDALTGEARRVGYRLKQTALARVDADRLLRAISAGETALPAAPGAQTPPVAQPSGAIELELWSDKLRYKSGELITIHAQATAPCNLTLVSLDPAGKATVLYPNEFETEGAIGAGQEVRVPGPQAPYQFRARAKGPEVVVGICTPTIRIADGIQPDYERQRFTVLGSWKAHLANALAEEAAERRNPARAAERTRTRGRQKGRSAEAARPEPRSRPETQARTAIRFEVE